MSKNNIFGEIASDNASLILFVADLKDAQKWTGVDHPKLMDWIDSDFSNSRYMNLKSPKGALFQLGETGFASLSHIDGKLIISEPSLPYLQKNTPKGIKKGSIESDFLSLLQEGPNLEPEPGDEPSIESQVVIKSGFVVVSDVWVNLVDSGLKEESKKIGKDVVILNDEKTYIIPIKNGTYELTRYPAVFGKNNQIWSMVFEPLQ